MNGFRITPTKPTNQPTKNNMSNKNSIEWAYNELSISIIKDDKEALESLFDLSIDLEDNEDNSPLTFSNHLPVPTILVDNHNKLDNMSIDENMKYCGFENIYAYTLATWGCIYDATDVTSLQVDDKNLYYEFKTRAKPPVAWLKEMSAMYPEMMFELHTNNEFELWEEFEVVYINGQEVVFEYKKKQAK